MFGYKYFLMLETSGKASPWFGFSGLTITSWCLKTNADPCVDRQLVSWIQPPDQCGLSQNRGAAAFSCPHYRGHWVPLWPKLPFVSGEKPRPQAGSVPSSAVTPWAALGSSCPKKTQTLGHGARGAMTPAPWDRHRSRRWREPSWYMRGPLHVLILYRHKVHSYLSSFINEETVAQWG